MDITTLGAAVAMAKKVMPQVTAADAGKLATVDSNGKWAAAELEVGQGEVAVDSTLLVTGAAADAKVTGDKVAELKSHLNDLDDVVGIINPVKINFEQGTLNNSTGEETDDDYRIRTDDYIPMTNIKSVTLLSVSGYQFNLFYYDKNKSFLSRTQGTSTEFTKAQCEYFKIVISRISSPTAFPNVNNPYTDYLGITIVYNDTTNFVSKKIAESFVGIGDVSELLFSFVPKNNFSDLTVINNKLYCFKASDLGVSVGTVFEYEVDLENKTATLTKELNHHWGHCNSVDYCQETDTLFIAYEYNSASLAPEDYISNIFYIIPNISQVIENATNNTLPELANCAIEYDCNSYDWGALLNGCWGYNNYGKNDLVIINTNRCKNFRVVQLGKGTNNLGLGVYTASADNEFNGSFAVIKSFDLDIDPPSGYVNQGADYYNGILYLAMGHMHDLYWMVELKSDGTAHVINERYMPITNASGTLQSGSTEGVCVTTTAMISQITTPLGNRVEIRKR